MAIVLHNFAQGRNQGLSRCNLDGPGAEACPPRSFSKPMNRRFLREGSKLAPLLSQVNSTQIASGRSQMKINRLNVMLFILPLVLFLTAWGQATRTLSGSVLNVEGASVPNAAVTVTPVS